jgi:predicted nuclease of restriction endonuclease-like (RecB) superfamily
MRRFYEEWSSVFNSADATAEFENNADNSIRPPAVVELTINTKLLFDINRPTVSDDFNWSYFFNVGFVLHCEIFTKSDSLQERLFYIERCAIEFWSKEKLKYNLKVNLYGKQGSMPNNFNKTVADIDFRKAALNAFKDEYLLDYINIEDPEDELDERVLEQEIVLNIKKFIMSLGKDFSFIGNQHRMIIEEKEFFVDLLFFNRQLQSLVAIETRGV